MYYSLKSPVEIGFPSRLIFYSLKFPYNLCMIAAAVSSLMSSLDNSIYKRFGFPIKLSTKIISEKGSVLKSVNLKSVRIENTPLKNNYATAVVPSAKTFMSVPKM